MPERKRRYHIDDVRRPLARRSFYAIGATAVGLVLFGSVMGLAVKSQGNVPLNVGAMAFSSLLFALCGLIYGIGALFEKEKNQILAKLAMVLDGLMILLWVIMLMVGLGLG